MSAVKMFIEAVKRDSPMSLRRVFPGRGRWAKEKRDAVRSAFTSGSIDGVAWDKVRGVFVRQDEE